MKTFLGVDVGTDSARAGLFDRQGNLLATASRDIQTWQPETDFAEQSSNNIWRMVCSAVREAIAIAKVKPSDVAGIGFDATCSLVAIDSSDQPVTLSNSGDNARNVILWADHRALNQALEIDATGHARLQASGGTISPEMQMPKLLWIKQNLRQSWAKAAQFFDLPDWLTYRATGLNTRSLCSTVCKWTYQGEKGGDGAGWDIDFLNEIGLDELQNNEFSRIGLQMAAPGATLGPLTKQAADELGLSVKTTVATSMIDAHAGALGTYGVSLEGGNIMNRLALIAGTSACHISLAPEPPYVPGVWGPYFGALLPDIWVNEAGQSMAGSAVETVIKRHSAASVVNTQAKTTERTIYQVLDRVLYELAGGEDFTLLTAERHILPDFHGNRAPLADPTRRGVTWGQGAIADIADLALDYLACLQSLAYGTRHIIEVMGEQGIEVDTIVVSGGLARNGQYLKAHADVTGCTVLVPDQPEPVLAGSAMLAAVGAGEYPDLISAMLGMSGAGTRLSPAPETADYHDRKYRVFHQMQDDFANYRGLMQPSSGT